MVSICLLWLSRKVLNIAAVINEYEDYEDEEGDNYDSEDEPPRKISRSHTFLSVASDSGLTRSVVNRDPTCASRVDKSITRLGGSDGNKQDGSAHNIESILDKKLNEFSNEGKLGPKVNDNLAKMVNTLLTSPMKTTEKNDLLDNYRRPENCSLNSPRVNDVISDLCIDSFGRSLDVKLQSIHKLLLKGLTPISDYLFFQLIIQNYSLFETQLSFSKVILNRQFREFYFVT
jgi:hypothetical protein